MSRALATLLLVGSVLNFAPVVDAQAPPKVARLGILDPHPAASFKIKTPDGDRVSSTMRKLGSIEGQNLVIERAYGEGQEHLIPQLAAELVRKRVGRTAAPALSPQPRRLPPFASIESLNKESLNDRCGAPSSPAA